MSRSQIARVWRWLALVLLLTLLAGCADGGNLPRIRAPRRGPGDVLADIIGQVSRLGEAIGRQIQRMTRGGR
jgi:hypothetical protein